MLARVLTDGSEVAVFSDGTSAWHTPYRDSVLILMELGGRDESSIPQSAKPSPDVRPFYLDRTRDASGVSGTGQVAEGVCFSDGYCALRWQTAGGSIGVYNSPKSLIEIHGHGGATAMVCPGCFVKDCTHWPRG